ncbi:hypothetical protein [Rubellimicrobium aerolatum]|uniref:Abi-like protein n=1 Tax=Rubellimicrobium aerolatum TaxID=490979 RepID=A0ABW0SFW3_9RHOB|nr:hypothetical protein [Rubellimicrobium aerolatum]MBP1806393.1 hypothetical protein [Rubellimicrobium aerolatum]
MRLSGAFYPVLGAAEVALRNRVASRLVQAYDPQWWRSASFRDHLGKKGIGIIKRAEATLAERGKAADSGRMTAELSFGFWVGTLLPKYEADLWTPLTAGFPDLPAGLDRAALHGRGEQLRDLRNRIFHHEPIFRRDVSLDHARCLEFIGWMSPAKAAWIRDQSEVMTLLRRRP